MSYLHKCAAVLALLLAPQACLAEGFLRHNVALELVLAADNSGSISAETQIAQRLGYAKAFRDPDLQRALFSGPMGDVAVVYFEWAGSEEQNVIVPWTRLSGTEDAIAFATRLEAAPINPPNGETSISEAMFFSESLFRASGYVGRRKVVDITSNGLNSEGRSLEDGLNSLRKIGATVNALLLPGSGSDKRGPYADLFFGYDGPQVSYFRHNVIGGPGAFILQVDPQLGFADAIWRKLVLEVAWADQ